MGSAADAAVALRTLRRDLMQQHGFSLRDLYRTLDTPGQNPLRTAHERLDQSVRAPPRPPPSLRDTSPASGGGCFGAR